MLTSYLPKKKTRKKVFLNLNDYFFSFLLSLLALMLFVRPFIEFFLSKLEII